jgi:hypothetical protein
VSAPLSYLGGPLAAAAAGLLGAALGAAAAAAGVDVAVTWPERSALFLVFMSSVTLRRPDVTAVPCGMQQMDSKSAEITIKKLCALRAL